MKKILFVSLLTVIVVSLLGGVALAGGWTSISYTASHDPDDETVVDGVAIWNPDEVVGATTSPHGSFSSTSNRCRVCHAVHLAGAASWRLLADGTNVDGEDRGMDRASECNFCHGVTGVTQKRPYRPKTYSVKGEHTLGSTDIPDDDGTDFPGTDSLSCGSCHTVHGAGDLNDASAAAGTYGTRILKQDPNQDGNILADGFAGRASAAEMATEEWATLSNFCGDCHNQNPNWTDTVTTTETANRPNPTSHVQGQSADGSLEVYGAIATVANWGSIDGNGSGPLTPQNTQTGCRGCHAAESGGNDSAATTVSVSAWPHQTKGAKLLFDTYTEGDEQQAAQTGGSGSVIDDADRILPRMDQLCAKCHVKGGDVDAVVDGQGVGASF